MGVISGRFKRVAAVFDEEARARLCETSGTEYSGGGQSLTDLSTLVDSFIEDGDGGLGGGGGDDDKAGSSPDTNCSDSEIKDALEKLFGWDSEVGDGKVKGKIHALVVKSLADVDAGDDGEVAGNDFKRRLMARLRQRGLDAGICKTKWDKDGRRPAGDYEFIDVNASGGRYIVEVSLAQEFTIARPTKCYSSLLNIFPRIFVGKQEELKKVTRLMCTSMKNSMKKMEIEVPPWRRLSYMQAKWLSSSYKRTTNEVAAAAADPVLHRDRRAPGDESRSRKRSVGFAPAANISFMCREDFSSRGGGGGGVGMRVGNLAAAFNDNTIIS